MYCTIQLVFLGVQNSVYTESGPHWIRLTMLPFSRWTEGQRALASLPGLKRLLSSGATQAQKQKGKGIFYRDSKSRETNRTAATDSRVHKLKWQKRKTELASGTSKALPSPHEAHHWHGCLGVWTHPHCCSHFWQQGWAHALGLQSPDSVDSTPFTKTGEVDFTKVCIWYGINASFAKQSFIPFSKFSSYYWQDGLTLKLHYHCKAFSKKKNF